MALKYHLAGILSQIRFKFKILNISLGISNL